MGTLAQPFTSLNENDNFIAGAYYAMTLLINEDHIPIVVQCMPTREELNGVTCHHFQRVKPSDPAFRGHTWSLPKTVAASQLPVMLEPLAEGEEF